MPKVRSFYRHAALLAVFFPLLAQAAPVDSTKTEKSWKQYLPDIHGTVRPRMEMSFGHDLPKAARFQVRNARLSIGGRVGPVFQYYFNTDFCDRGSIKILDVWARVNMPGNVSFQMGQFRMPFGVDPFRGPNTYIFSNRSFIGKQMCNVRAVGAKLMYTIPVAPLSLEAGIFNPTPIGNHIVWNQSFAYAAKATYRLGEVSLATGFQSIRPDGIRTNLVDGAVTWTPSQRWTVEGEYMYKHYTHKAHKHTHGWLIWADYKMPIKAWVFNRLSFQGRYEGMTDHSSAVRDENGLLTTTDCARNRITVGSTISWYRSANLYVDLRANYEKSFYHKDAPVSQSDGDKFLLEMVLRF